jgi:hypothetical protein
MNRRLTTAACAAALALLVCSAALASDGPIAKQDPLKPAFAAFTSICAVPGYANFGFCNGSTTKFSEVKGKIGQALPSRGRWHLRISFDNLTPGAYYRLWGNRDGLAIQGKVDGFFQIATAQAFFNGSVFFDYVTTDPENLGLDLNQLSGPTDGGSGVTIVTSYWSKQFLHVNPDGTLYAD